MSIKLIENKKIAIIGGGPGGLTLARLLQLKGCDVKVYERDISRNARVQGATLDLHEESGLAALAAAGLMDAFKANYRPGADKMRVVDKDVKIIWDDHISDRDGESRPEIDRGPLQKILLGSLQPDTMIWNSQFISLADYDDGWKVHFKDGTSAYADLVIAADGASSKLRPYITPIKSFYSGYTAVEGAVYNAAVVSPKIDSLLKGGKIFAFGNSKSLIVSSKGDGSLVFYPCFKADEDWITNCGIDFNNKVQVLSWFKKEFSGWDKKWLELFENATTAFVPRPLDCMPFHQTWDALPNLTMLGDAAHLMPPYAGEGVNMAMRDALDLTQHLTAENHENVHSAIAAYEQQMRKRAGEAAQQSMDALIALHAPGAITYMMNIIRE